MPAGVDEQIATLKLRTMGIVINELTGAQQAYLASWTSGT